MVSYHDDVFQTQTPTKLCAWNWTQDNPQRAITSWFRVSQMRANIPYHPLTWKIIPLSITFYLPLLGTGLPSVWECSVNHASQCKHTLDIFLQTFRHIGFLSMYSFIAKQILDCAYNYVFLWLFLALLYVFFIETVEIVWVFNLWNGDRFYVLTYMPLFIPKKSMVLKWFWKPEIHGGDFARNS